LDVEGGERLVEREGEPRRRAQRWQRQRRERGELQRERAADARERGQTPRSRELTTAALLLAGAAGVSIMGPQVTQKAMEFLRSGLTISRAAAFDPAVAMETAGHIALIGIVPALPLLGLLFIAALAAPLAIGGWVFSTEPITPDFSRLNPMRGLANLVSLQSAAELGKAILKVILIGGVVGSLVWRDQSEFVVPLSQDSGVAMAWVGKVITRDFLWMAAILLVIAAADVPLQIWQHGRGLRMSQDEVKRESKESEGDPHIKGKIRQRQREADVAVNFAGVLVKHAFWRTLEIADLNAEARRLRRQNHELIALEHVATGDAGAILVRE
jgi:flagellar biosynthetic protein FlhB